MEVPTRNASVVSFGCCPECISCHAGRGRDLTIARSDFGFLIICDRVMQNKRKHVPISTQRVGGDVMVVSTVSSTNSTLN
jgi:hypothetical protein